VILSEDHRAPLVAVDVWYHVGAVNERKGRSGFAHIFEHLMFQEEAPQRGRAYRLRAARAQRRDEPERHDRVGPHQLLRDHAVGPARADALAGERSDGLLARHRRSEKLDTQREVVRKRTATDPREYAVRPREERLVQLLYPDPHPYFGYVIGSHEDLEKASLDDVRNFFHTYYSPNNAAVAIVGDFRQADVKPLVEKYFGPIPRGPEPAPVTAKTEPAHEEIRETMRDQVQLAKVLIGYVGPGPLEHPAAALLMRILAGASRAACTTTSSTRRRSPRT